MNMILVWIIAQFEFNNLKNGAKAIIAYERSGNGMV